MRVARCDSCLRDRGCKYVASCDQVFTAEGISVRRTPLQAPRANACAARWVRTVRRECLDLMPICGRGHLEKALAKTPRPRHWQAAPSWTRGCARQTPGKENTSWSARAHQYEAKTCLAGWSTSMISRHEWSGSFCVLQGGEAAGRNHPSADAADLEDDAASQASARRHLLRQDRLATPSPVIAWRIQAGDQDR
jgi:hypothetical protein